MAKSQLLVPTGGHPMLTRILHNSEKLCTFFDRLNLALSKPQQQHILNLADALLVCEDEKTLEQIPLWLTVWSRAFRRFCSHFDWPWP
jgi:hypothetical protein